MPDLSTRRMVPEVPSTATPRMEEAGKPVRAARQAQTMACHQSSGSCSCRGPSRRLASGWEPCPGTQPVSDTATARTLCVPRSNPSQMQQSMGLRDLCFPRQTGRSLLVPRNVLHVALGGVELVVIALDPRTAYYSASQDADAIHGSPSSCDFVTPEAPFVLFKDWQENTDSIFCEGHTWPGGGSCVLQNQTSIGCLQQIRCTRGSEMRASPPPSG